MPETSKCPNCGGQFNPAAADGMCPKCLLLGAKTSNPPRAVTQPPEPSSGKPLPPKPLAVGSLFPELEILDVIGQGGMGVVYKARQKNLGREVAVKLLSTSLMNDPTFAERFTREARAMAMMNHPNIISIYDFGQRENYYYLVMEYIDGLNLRQLVSSTKLEPAEALELVPQLCDALQYAHDRGIVHRDIKPENVLVSQDGRVKIADFGLAKLTGQSAAEMALTHTRQVMGTLNYMAPEQMEKPTEVDHRADIYSLGVVIYELLTGELPIGKFSPPSRKVKVDVRLDEVVMRALEKEPSLRYQQASEFKTGLQTFSSSKRVLSPTESREIDLAIKIGKFVYLAVAITILIGGILLVVFSKRVAASEAFFIAGFVCLGTGGLMLALLGAFAAVFQPKPKVIELAEPVKQSEETEKAPPPSSVMVIRGFGMACFFLCALFFIISSGSFANISSGLGLGENGAKFMGIATAMLGAFLMVVSGMVAEAKGYEEDDD